MVVYRLKNLNVFANVFRLKKLHFSRKKVVISLFVLLFNSCSLEGEKTPKPFRENQQNVKLNNVSQSELINRHERDLIKNKPSSVFMLTDSLSNSSLGILDLVSSHPGQNINARQTATRLNIQYLGSTQRLGYKIFLLSSVIELKNEKANRHSILVYFRNQLEARYIVKSTDFFPRKVMGNQLIFEIFDENYNSQIFSFNFNTDPPACLNFDNYSTCVSQF